MFLRFCQQAMERVEFIKVFLAKLFASNPNASVSVISLSLGVTYKLFDSLFLPILLYGSEVWGIYDKDNFNT